MARYQFPLRRESNYRIILPPEKCLCGSCIVCPIRHQEAGLVGFGSVFQPDAVHHGREDEQSGARGWEHVGAPWKVARPRGIKKECDRKEPGIMTLQRPAPNDLLPLTGPASYRFYSCQVFKHLWRLVKFQHVFSKPSPVLRLEVWDLA